LGLVLSALLIKDHNSEDNSKTYLIMLSLTIIGLQGIIPKLMAMQRGWFRHARMNFGRFASLGTKTIGT
jgi:integral membrane sensor domain MASE1